MGQSEELSEQDKEEEEDEEEEALEGEEGQEKEVGEELKVAGERAGGAEWAEPRWSVRRASAMVQTENDLGTGSPETEFTLCARQRWPPTSCVLTSAEGVLRSSDCILQLLASTTTRWKQRTQTTDDVATAVCACVSASSHLYTKALFPLAKNTAANQVLIGIWCNGNDSLTLTLLQRCELSAGPQTSVTFSLFTIIIIIVITT